MFSSTFSSTMLSLILTTCTFWGDIARRRFLRSPLTMISTRAHLKPPPVLPALAPITISPNMIALEKVGHRSKSVVAYPVVVTMLAT